MTDRFLKAFNFMQKNEGGFSEDKRDKGGATIYGVSSKWFPEVYNQIMNCAPEELQGILQNFYLGEFWNSLYDQLLHEDTAIRLFDLGVNMGKVEAVKILQNTFNNLSNLKIGEDGKFGAGTLNAINHPPIDAQSFYVSYQNHAEAYYRTLPDFNTYGKGWLDRLYRAI